MNTKIDPSLRVAICQCIRQVLHEELSKKEDNEEVWLDEKTLCQQFQMFTPSFLKRFGASLPRTQAMVRADNGQLHPSQGFVYPRNMIQRMIMNNEIKMLQMPWP